MNDTEIKVGETYRIREWDDLVREYGTCDFGNTSVVFAKTPIPFPSTYRDKCGSLFTVKNVMHAYRESEPHYFDPLMSEEGVEVLAKDGGKTRVLVITAEMLEPIDDPIFEEITIESIVDFLLCQKNERNDE